MSAFFLTPFYFLGQNDMLKLKPGSEKLSFDEKRGINTLVGNVHFEYQGNEMYCDSAVYFQKQNKVKAYGNVHITKNKNFMTSRFSNI